MIHMKSNAVQNIILFTLMLISTSVLAHGTSSSSQEKIYKKKSIFSLPAESTNIKSEIQMDMKIEQQQIRLIITDKYGMPVDVELGSAKIFISSGKINKSVQLLPEGKNILSAYEMLTPDSDIKMYVTLRLPGRRPINKEFMPFAKQ